MKPLLLPALLVLSFLALRAPVTAEEEASDIVWRTDLAAARAEAAASQRPLLIVFR
jgi:hypothetical protein